MVQGNFTFSLRRGTDIIISNCTMLAFLTEKIYNKIVQRFPWYKKTNYSCENPLPSNSYLDA